MALGDTERREQYESKRRLRAVPFLILKRISFPSCWFGWFDGEKKPPEKKKKKKNSGEEEKRKKK